MDTFANSLVERLLQTGFDGKSRFDSAHEIARSALQDNGGDPERAVDAVIATHRKLAASAGFVTGVGGLVTMPVAVPANVMGFYLLSTRMTAAIAAIRGYDIDQREVRSAVLLTLIGTDAGEVMKKAGLTATGGITGVATRKLPPAALMILNKAVGFRLASRLGGQVLARLGKSIPLAGGFIGAGVDLFLLNRIASNARDELTPRRSITS